MSKLILQIINGFLGLTTAGLGTVQVIFGLNSPLYAAANLPEFPILDSNLRFFGGMGLGLGLILLWILPTIDQRGLLFRAVWICAFLGGIGRLISIITIGSPSNLLLGFTALEIIGAPLLVLWQYRIALKADV